MGNKKRKTYTVAFCAQIEYYDEVSAYSEEEAMEVAKQDLACSGVSVTSYGVAEITLFKQEDEDGH